MAQHRAVPCQHYLKETYPILDNRTTNSRLNPYGQLQAESGCLGVSTRGKRKRITPSPYSIGQPGERKAARSKGKPNRFQCPALKQEFPGSGISRS